MRCALGYDMGPGARPVILPVTAPRNRAREYLVKRASEAGLMTSIQLKNGVVKQPMTYKLIINIIFNSN